MLCRRGNEKLKGPLRFQPTMATVARYVVAGPRVLRHVAPSSSCIRSDAPPVKLAKAELEDVTLAHASTGPTVRSNNESALSTSQVLPTCPPPRGPVEQIFFCVEKYIHVF